MQGARKALRRTRPLLKTQGRAKAGRRQVARLARVVRVAGEKVDYATQVDQIHVTDPVQKELQAISSRLEWLEKMLDDSAKEKNL